MLQILPYSSEHAADIVSLILPIQQQEFGIAIALDTQPDLRDIAHFYQVAGGNFWVAVDDGRVVGTVGLLDIGNGQAALRKMFVAASHRGADRGVAAQLLKVLFASAGTNGISDVFLGTTDKFLAAHRFYEKNGFSEVSRDALPERFPVMAVDSRFYWRPVDPDEPRRAGAPTASRCASAS